MEAAVMVSMAKIIIPLIQNRASLLASWGLFLGIHLHPVSLLALYTRFIIKAVTREGDRVTDIIMGSN